MVSSPRYGRHQRTQEDDQEDEQEDEQEGELGRSNLPHGSGLPDSPILPDLSDLLDIWQLPDLPDVPDVPNLPDGPDLPDSPDLLDIWQMPGVADLPDVPDFFKYARCVRRVRFARFARCGRFARFVIYPENASSSSRFGARIRAAAGVAFSCNAMWCGIARLYFPHPPRTVKVTLAFPVGHRDGETMGNSTADSATQWTRSSICRP